MGQNKIYDILLTPYLSTSAAKIPFESINPPPAKSATKLIGGVGRPVESTRAERTPDWEM